MEYYALDQKLALFAVFMQVALTFYAIFRMGQMRIRSIRQFRIPLSEIAIDARRYPEQAQVYSNNLSNQFETPILLYTAVLFAMVYDANSMVLSWLTLAYVLSRYVHRYIHVKRNNVVLRFQVYLAGVIFLGLAWIVLGLSILEWI